MSSETVEMVALPSLFAQVQLSGLKDIVDHHRANGHEVQFDASALERIDGAAVQFLVAVSQLQDTVQDKPLILNSNEVLQAALDDMGVAELVGATSEPCTTDSSLAT